jgi:hypothetical protein
MAELSSNVVEGVKITDMTFVEVLSHDFITKSAIFFSLCDDSD